MKTNAQRLCLECGLCCNGVIFARGELKRDDDRERLREFGFKLRIGPSGVTKFSQPCPALQCGACRVYETRPQYCREFDCALLKQVLAGKTTMDAAARITKKAKRLAREADQLLRECGDSDNGTALSLRFRRTARRMEARSGDEKACHVFGELTNAMHQLNLLLSARFYPGV